MVWEFERARNDPEKARIALAENPLFDYDKALEAARSGQSALTQNELESLERMSTFKNHMVGEVRNLYAAFSRDDIRVITQKNPFSLYTLFDSFLMVPAERPDCSNEDIIRLSEKLGSDAFLKSAQNFTDYAWIRESQFSGDYINRIRDLIKSDARFSEYKNLEETYFKLTSYESKDMKAFSSAIGTDPNASLKYARQKLLESGQREATLDQDVFQLARLAPGCFLNTFAFYKMQKIWKANRR